MNLNRYFPVTLLLGLVLFQPAHSQAASRGLDIYFIDVEGGAATLVVTPAGQSLLIDTGFPGERDAGRIAYVALHVGGVPALAKLIPIKNYYDHGLPQAIAADMQAEYIEAYKQTTVGKSVTLKPGDEIKLARSKYSPSLQVRVLAAGGIVLGEKPGAPQTQPCGTDFKALTDDQTDNVNSVGILLTFGGFRFFDGGDLSWNIENRLVCPKNLIGVVDVYQVDHHGTDVSNNPKLIGALNPRVAVIDNGPRKGGEAGTYARLKSNKAVEAIYQLHRSLRTTDRDNTMSGYIANEAEECQGNFIKLSVDRTSKSYTLTIPAKQISRSYRTR